MTGKILTRKTMKGQLILNLYHVTIPINVYQQKSDIQGYVQMAPMPRSLTESERLKFKWHKQASWTEHVYMEAFLSRHCTAQNLILTELSVHVKQDDLMILVAY